MWRPGDLRFAARALVARPAYSLTAILTLTLGIGANTAIYSVTKAVLLNPLPYPEPDRLVVISEVGPDGNLDRVSVPTFQDWQAQADRFETLAAYRHENFTFAESREPLDVPGLLATPELFQVLRAEAFRGRTFTADEAVFGRHRAAILTHGFWQRHFGGEDAVIGRTIDLDAEPHTIVGVMPPGFAFPPGGDAELFRALAFNPNDLHGRSRRARSLVVIGRLASGATVEEAAGQMAVSARQIAVAYPESNGGWSARVTAVHEQLVSGSRRALFVLLGAVGFLLLIVCANVANLMLARLSSRRRDLAVRAALGASRLQLVRPIFAESLLLGLAGGGFGLLVALILLRFVRTLPPGSLPRLDDVQLDGGVLVVTLAVSVAVALVFGLLPALHASRASVREDLTETAGTTGGFAIRRALGGLIVVEVALALALLVGAGLLARSFTRLMAVDPGFEPRNLLAAQIYLPAARYGEPHDRIAFFERALERLRALPGVRSAGAVTSLPMHPVGIDFALPFTIEGQLPAPADQEPRADVRIATPDYFQTMGMSLVRGRLLEERDVDETPHVMLINRTMARRHFQGLDPIGRVVRNPHGRSEIVGVVSDLRHQGLASEPRPEMYVPLTQSPVPGMALLVRTEEDPAAYRETVQRAIWDVDPAQPIFDLSTLTEAIDRSVFLPRISMQVLGAFALVALLMAAVGIYGVISYSVSQRTREIGLRMALGAGRRDTLWLVVRGSMGLMAAGVAIGLAGSALLARALSGLLFEVSPLDPVVFAAVALLLGLVGLVASVVPARRASTLDPMLALREE